MKQTNINIDEIKRFPTVTNPIKADDLHTCKVYQYSPARCIVTDYTDEQRADLLEMTKGREIADGIVFASSKYVLSRLHSWQNHEAQKQRAAILGEGWQWIEGLNHGTQPGDVITCTDGTRGRVTKSDPESCCIEFETADGHRLSVAGYFRYTPSEKLRNSENINNEAKTLAERIINTLKQTGASAWAERVADKTILVTRHNGSRETLRVLFIDEDNCVSDDFQGVTAERAAQIIIGAREHDGKTLTATLNVIFSAHEDYERGKQLFDSEGESRLWAGDWDDERQSIEFCDSMPLGDLERDVRSELDAQGFENYATVDGEEMWV